MAEIKTLTVNGKTYAVADADAVSFEEEQNLTADQQARARDNIGAACIDDTKAGQDAWSSKNTVDKLCPAFAESGSVVICQPVAGYPLEVVSRLAATEVPYTSVKLTQSGKNLVVYPYYDTTKTVNGITFTDNADGSITINGTAEANAVFYFRNYKTWDVKREANYTASLHVVSGSYQGGKPSMAVNYYPIGGGAYRGWLWAMPNEPKAAPCPAEMTSICSYVVITTGITCSNLVVRPQLEAGTVATGYEPYREGKMFTAELDGPVYGGNFNWTTGVLTDQEGNACQLTPKEIPALSGVNTLYSDTGDTCVTGRENPAAIINKLTNAILSLGGNV